MLNLQLELTRTGASGAIYKPHSELVEKLSSENFSAIRDKCEVDGWEIHSWSVSEQLPFDEGCAAAMAGRDSDANPYAEHFWKYNEWWLGWDSHQDSNSLRKRMMKEEEIVQKGIDLPLAAPAVHRMMNERMHAAILEAIMSAAEEIGWRFEYTQETHEMSCLARTHIIEAIWPAQAKFTRPRLYFMAPETFDQWGRDAIEDGWAANWLDMTLDSLQQLGIRPVPNTKARQPDS